jgi:hypothetical protein
MPIKIKGQHIDNPIDQFALENKRASRVSNRTKYFLMRKDKTPEDYQRVKLVIDGKEIEISDSSKFLLEQLITDEKEE